MSRLKIAQRFSAGNDEFKRQSPGRDERGAIASIPVFRTPRDFYIVEVINSPSAKALGYNRFKGADLPRAENSYLTPPDP